MNILVYSKYIRFAKDPVSSGGAGNSGTSSRPKHTHYYTEQRFDAYRHWLGCSCTKMWQPEAHTYVDNVCSVCGYEREALETKPVETEPIETEPIETEPVETEPVETDPVDTEPVETDPIETVPIETEPIETDPTEDDPEAKGNNTALVIAVVAIVVLGGGAALLWFVFRKRA